MTVITNARPVTSGWTARARHTLTVAARQGAQVVSAARHQYRRPALTIGGLGFIDAAFFQHGWFAGLLAVGVSVLVFEGVAE